jgi:hypothetical protein
VSGYWKAPKFLADLLDDGVLTRTDYVVLHYVAERGADFPGGLRTSQRELAVRLKYHRKVIAAALRRLRQLELLEYEDHERVSTVTLRVSGNVDPPVRPSQVGRSTPPSDTPRWSDAAGSPTDRNPASDEGSAGKVASTPEAPLIPKLETHTPLPSGVGRSLVQQLVGEYVARYEERNGERPPGRVVALVGRMLAEMERDGVSVTTASKALDRLLDRKLDATLLPRLAADVAGGPPVTADALDALAARVRRGPLTRPEGDEDG